MAIYSFRQSVVSGGSGRSAVASAAYRHACVMFREQTELTINYSKKLGGVHSELALPDDAPAWVRDQLGFADPDVHRLDGPQAVAASEILWNAVERGEKRIDARYATDLIVALPRELSEAQNIELIRDFVRQNYTDRGRIADWAYHAPEDKQHNPHAHIMTTVRPLTETGFGAKTIAQLDADGVAIRSDKGAIAYAKWAGSKPELLAVREAWATSVNVALHEAGIEATVDHRSFRDRGIADLEPTAHHGLVHHIGSVREHDAHVRSDLETRARNFQALVENPSLVLEHITRERSTFDTRDVARLIHRYAGEGDDFASLYRRVGALPELVTIQAQIHDPETNSIVQRERFTTASVLEREAAMMESAERRAADASFAVDRQRKDAAIERAQATQGFAYTPEQVAAIERLTQATGLSPMVGIAGAGKSTVLRAVGEVYKGEGASVYGAALAGKAADNLQLSSGIESRTLASWENAWSSGYDRLAPGSVFVIDEAGMVASAQMARVMAELDGFGAKVIMVGDARQLQPIEAGAAFRTIATEVGYVELTEVRRQERSDHAEASVLFGAGDAKSALNIYHGNDTFRPHDTRADALSAAIAGWHSDWLANTDVVMLAHTNVDVRDLNDLARSAIQAEGGLADERTIMTARGHRQFAIGDRVLFLENDRQLAVRNGSIGTVASFADGTMFVDVPDRETAVPIAPGGYINVDHGYATTIHKSQGSTHDRVHIVAGGMMDAQLTYVALSRHREEVTMHVPLEAFTRPGADKLATVADAMERLAADKLKDTSLDFRATSDYREARAALEADRAAAANPTFHARFEAFLEHRGLPHPSDVLQSIKDYAAAFLDRARDASAGERISLDARIDAMIAKEQQQVRGLEPDALLQGALARLDHVQQHSAAMNHEGLARRSAFHTAENELTHMRTAEPLRAYAERVAQIVPPTTVVAIGRTLTEAHDEPRLAHLRAPVRDALQANWTTIHAVSRAAWELGLLETVRTVDTSYAQERADRATLAAYERTVAPATTEAETPARSHAVEPVARVEEPIVRSGDVPIVIEVEAPKPFLPAVERWSQTIDEAVAHALVSHPSYVNIVQIAERDAGTIWREPQAAMTKLNDALAAEPSNVAGVLKELQRSPQSYGDLQGGRTLLLKPDGDRQKALNAVAIFANTMATARDTARRLEPGLRDQEIQWRKAMARPVPALSVDAMTVVRELNRAHAMKRPDREPAHQVALGAMSQKDAFNEVRLWRGEMEARLAPRHAVDRIPGLTQDQRVEIATTLSQVDVALREANATRTIEQSRERSLERSRSQERDRGGYER
ncbi:Ti-type conjugative transfer relaxase TraA [Aureimonas jatrophae]|uniref:Ti-type conjugative transfer relaxase TraA n=1 Tax=Aureimonas jatrophae TaxID=1166073 RepID=A0A1H0N0V9_9HYPH|nr:Ti-type conjugative transfer relaxase TraA [Aureimonas jatrophae]